MVSLRVCMNLGMLVFLLVSRDTLFCIGKEMERSTVTGRTAVRGRSGGLTRGSDRVVRVEADGER